MNLQTADATTQQSGEPHVTLRDTDDKPPAQDDRLDRMLADQSVLPQTTQCLAVRRWDGTADGNGGLMASTDLEVRQFVHGEPDGPVKFHYPAAPMAEDFGLAVAP